MSYKKIMKKALSEAGLDEEQLLRDVKQKVRTVSVVGYHRPIRRVAILAAMLAMAILFCSAGIPALYRYFNMMTETYANETYIEIYTAEDLDAVRHNLSANYRLMRDIVFTDEDYAEGGRFAGGFVPLGDIGNHAQSNYGVQHFTGIFDGNGHTIYNLRLSTQGGRYLGLFASTIPLMDTTEEEAAAVPKLGIIMNLRISGGEIDAGNHTASDLYVGAIAGWASAVVQCQVENFTVRGKSELNASSQGVCATGGIAGVAEILDSCYVDAQVSGGQYCGKIAGMAQSLITCAATGDGALCGYYSVAATMIPIAAFDRIMTFFEERIESGDSDAQRRRDIFLAFYDAYHPVTYTAEAIQGLEKVFSRYSYQNITSLAEGFYVWDKTGSSGERLRIDTLLRETVGEDVTSILAEHGVKLGNLYSYSVAEGERYEGFDFESIWLRTDGAPRLRIFAETISE